MTDPEVYTRLRDHFMSTINTWEELYEFFDTSLQRANDRNTLPAVLDALYCEHSFLLAMRELPDEGDVKVLVERMLHIMVVECKEKLNTDLTLLMDEPPDSVPPKNREAQGNRLH